MFNFRHPRPVVDGRAVAAQIVQQKSVKRQTAVLVAEPAPPAPADEAASRGEEAVPQDR